METFFKKNGTAVRAHPGYPDLVGFGRRKMAVSPAERKAMVMYQIGALSAFCQAEGIPLQHGKPHGAMYNMAAKDEKLADAIAEAVAAVDGSLTLVGLSGSCLKAAADRFLTRCRAEDGRACWGECAGSARNPYYVSIDWSLSEKEPVYSCSCASRHFPCKHALALMFDLLAGKAFGIDEPPAYLLRVRAREQRERERAAQRLEKARKYDASVKQKKLERQLAALDKAEKLSDQLLTDGLAAIPALPAQTLERLPPAESPVRKTFDASPPYSAMCSEMYFSAAMQSCTWSIQVAFGASR